jgi:hypothetical protein
MVAITFPRGGEDTVGNDDGGVGNHETLLVPKHRRTAVVVVDVDINTLIDLEQIISVAVFGFY